MSAAENIEFTTVPLTTMEQHDLAQQLVHQSVSMMESNLFVLCDDTATSVAVRTTGQIERLATLPLDLARHLINHFKTMAGLDIAERRRPQEGRWIYAHNGERIDLRLNIVPTLFGED